MQCSRADTSYCVWNKQMCTFDAKKYVQQTSMYYIGMLQERGEGTKKKKTAISKKVIWCQIVYNSTQFNWIHNKHISIQINVHWHRLLFFCVVLCFVPARLAHANLTSRSCLLSVKFEWKYAQIFFYISFFRWTLYFIYFFSSLKNFDDNEAYNFCSMKLVFFFALKFAHLVCLKNLGL